MCSYKIRKKTKSLDVAHKKRVDKKLATILEGRFMEKANFTNSYFNIFYGENT